MMQTTEDTFCDGLEPAQRESIRAVLRHFPAVTEARLYGSRAMGRYRPGSDIDLTLFGEIDLIILNRISTELDDLLLPYHIDLSAWNHIDNDALRAHIERVGTTFYRKQ